MSCCRPDIWNTVYAKPKTKVNYSMKIENQESKNYKVILSNLWINDKVWKSLPCRDISVLLWDKPFFHTLHTFCSYFNCRKNSQGQLWQQQRCTFKTMRIVSGARLIIIRLLMIMKGTVRQHQPSSFEFRISRRQKLVTWTVEILRG